MTPVPFRRITTIPCGDGAAGCSNQRPLCRRRYGFTLKGATSSAASRPWRTGSTLTQERPSPKPCMSSQSIPRAQSDTRKMGRRQQKNLRPSSRMRVFPRPQSKQQSLQHLRRRQGRPRYLRERTRRGHRLPHNF